MFSKKDKEDKYAEAKVILKIAARRVLASYPAASAIINLICAYREETDLSGVATTVLEKNTDLFDKDPLLKEDIKDVLTLTGLHASDIEVPKAQALIGVLCSLV